MAEANAVLSDPQRRERYDMGEDEDGSDASGMGGPMHMDLSELFAQLHSGGGSFAFRGGGFPHSHSHSFGF